jgi:hypothetical protein
VVQFGERVTVRERVRRSPAPAVLAGEAVLAGAGLIVAAGVRRSSADDSPDGRDALGIGALSLGLGAAVALAIDGSRYADHEIVTSTIEADGRARVAPCAVPGRRPTRVELRTPGGRSFTSPLDARGRGRVRLPDDVWADDGVDFDLLVDGVVVRRVTFLRMP